ncbi:metal ABC transporter ATP-binding protein [Acinetobacter qingfengensis]|uniref:Zinc ABC transporter ATP-binding protein n=1 Tax=Acinetobacter qingfengensis TaxID=1262585 RepID=A0A1E7RCS2_9GAMM|nr:metal ABC transporter ATP-binding protein [Acinetobacter qingfengensis]KAA8732130.1 metal ABC transporter ATP-binding protein [Acinetobacter qingfengensis]OEY97209.1 zinc ABC transporter ATP-binding protein [Acinetobacter qingfengensis]
MSINAASPLVQLQQVNITFDQRQVLKNIDLSIMPNEIVALIGPNGAGKSTLIKILLGIEKAPSGKVIYQPRLKLAYVPQKFHPSTSLPLRVKDLLSLEFCDPAYKKNIIRDTGIEGLQDYNLHRLSGGERQRVLLARALLRQPQLLVLDEPMQGLDIQSEEELYTYVRTLPERLGCSVLMVSHDLQWVMQGTKRVICLNHHICCTGTPENIQQHPEYVAIFGQRVPYQHHHDHCIHGDHAEPCDHLPHPHIHPEVEPK